LHLPKLSYTGKFTGQTSALAIIHAHSTYAVVESLLAGPDERIVPEDSEGQYFLGDIPIVRGGIGSRELAGNLVNAPLKAQGRYSLQPRDFCNREDAWRSLYRDHGSLSILAKLSTCTSLRQRK